MTATTAIIVAPLLALAVDAILKSTVVLLATSTAAWLLRKRSASLRHLVWATGLASALVLPFLGMVLPAWQPKVAERAMQSVARIRESPSKAASIEVSTMRPASTPKGVPSPAASQAPSRITLLRVTFSIWIIGVLAVASFLAIEIMKLASVVFRSDVVRRQSWRDLTNEVGRQLQLKRTVRLRRNPNASVLGTWGSLRPSVLLPRESSGWSGDRMRVVLSHELAHVKRNDWLVQIIAETSRAIYWFNPLFWIACSQIRRESEHACDDAAMRLGVDGPTYATHVLDLARTLHKSGRPGTAALAMASTSNLERRLLAMLNPALNRQVATRSAVVFVILIAGCLTLPLAAFQLSPAHPLLQGIPATENRTQPPIPAKDSASEEPGSSNNAAPIAQNVSGYVIQPPIKTARTEQLSRADTRQISTVGYYSILGERTSVTIVQNTPGAISGTVFDSTHALIPGVWVSLTELATGKETRTLTNDVGSFYFPQLSPGDYSMSSTLENFRTSRNDAIHVTAGQEAQVAVGLQVKAPAITVDIIVSTPGLSCFSVFGTIKADGTPFTPADCPNGTIVLPKGPSPASTLTAIETSTGNIAVVGSTPIAVPQTQRPPTDQQPLIRMGGYVQPGRLLSSPKPPYPADARSRGVEGVVILVATIGTDGSVKSVKAIASSDASLEKSSLDAVQQWRFTPTLLNNQPVETTTNVTLNFSMTR